MKRDRTIQPRERKETHKYPDIKVSRQRFLNNYNKYIQKKEENIEK